MIPFILLHQSGFTLRFVELCHSLCQTGMNFHSLEGIIGHICWKRYEERRQIYRTYVEVHKASDSQNQSLCSNLSPPFESSVYYELLSSDIICKCFVANFLENEQSYKRAIEVVKVGEELCLTTSCSKHWLLA